MELPPFLHRDPLGEIFLKGHRISLFQMLWYYNEGFTELMLAEQFPTLCLDLIREVIDFYQKNTAEVDQSIREVQRRLDHLRATGKQVDVETMRQRYEALYGKGPAPSTTNP